MCKGLGLSTPCMPVEVIAMLPPRGLLPPTVQESCVLATYRDHQDLGDKAIGNSKTKMKRKDNSKVMLVI